MLRQAQDRYTQSLAQRSVADSVAAPIGGLNARDAIANMNPRDAIILENLFATPTSVDVRRGYRAFATFTGLNQTVMVYSGLTATKIFAAVKNASVYSVYDATAGGALSTAAVGGAGNTIQALGNARFDYANFGTIAGHYLLAVNGTNPPLEYNGTAWVASALTGLTVSNLSSVGVYGTRLWFVEKDSANVWYLATATKDGALTKFNLGSVFKNGGYLSSFITITDAANTLNDYAAFLSSEGEIVAYQGDPASTFSRVAQFQIGRPAVKGNRAWIKWGTDALVLCADGVYPLRKAIADNSRDSGLAVSDKIRPLINSDIAIYAANLDWQLMVHPTGAKLIVNVPRVADIASFQYVMNTQSKAWCTFTGWSAFNFAVSRDTLYMGMSGKLVVADSGMSDSGADIFSEVLQAYHYYGTRERIKMMKMAQPVFSTSGTYGLAIQFEADFKPRTLSLYRTVPGGAGDPFGTGTWDVSFGGSPAPDTKRYGIGATGRAIATHFKTRTNEVSLTWSATNVIYELGGILG